MSTNLGAKYAERDALSSWLGALEREDAPLEAVRLVRAQLDRVLKDIARLGGGRPRGSAHPTNQQRDPPAMGDVSHQKIRVLYPINRERRLYQFNTSL